MNVVATINFFVPGTMESGHRGDRMVLVAPEWRNTVTLRRDMRRTYRMAREFGMTRTCARDFAVGRVLCGGFGTSIVWAAA